MTGKPTLKFSSLCDGRQGVNYWMALSFQLVSHHLWEEPASRRNSKEGNQAAKAATASFEEFQTIRSNHPYVMHMTQQPGKGTVLQKHITVLGD